MCTLCICFYEEQLPEKTYKQTHTHKKEKQQNKKATCTSTEKLDNSFGKKQKCNGTYNKLDNSKGHSKGEFHIFKMVVDYFINETRRLMRYH